MALSVLSITPADGDNFVTIDSEIIIEFSGPVDPFTVGAGISIYVETDNTWSGPDLAALDTKYRDVLDIGPDYSFYPYKYTVVGNTVTLVMGVSLLPNKTHYISVLPGNDANRYISEPTVGVPVYNKANPLDDGTIDIITSYTGKTDGLFTITFSDVDKIDVVQDSNYLGQYIYAPNQPVSIGEIDIVVFGAFGINDTVDIPVFKAVGVDAIYKSKFVTSKYEITVPTSVRIADKIKTQSSLKSLKIIGTIPQGLSVNNGRCNPIIIRFSQPVDALQDFMKAIKVSKTSLETGQMKAINYYVKAVGDTVKIYLVSVNNTAPVDQAIDLDNVIKKDIRERLNVLGY